MISLRMDPDLEEELRLAAKAKGVSKSKFLRMLLIERLQSDKDRERLSWELGKDLFGKHGSGRSDLSRNRKNILKEKIRGKASRH